MDYFIIKDFYICDDLKNIYIKKLIINIEIVIT